MVDVRTPLSALVLALGVQSLLALTDNQPWMTRLKVENRGRMFPRPPEPYQRFVWEQCRSAYH